MALRCKTDAVGVTGFKRLTTSLSV